MIEDLIDELSAYCAIINSTLKSFWSEVEEALSLTTYNRKVKSQVDHGADPWSKMTSLYGAVWTANRHGGSHPLFLRPDKSSHNKNGIYWGITAQDLAVNAQYHTS